MKFNERNEMMSYLSRPATPKASPLAASNEELGFAIGGRAGFKDAGLASNEPVKAGELLSYLKKYGVDIHPGNMARAAQMYGIESPSSGKYILPPEDKIKTIKDEWYKNQQRAPATTEIGRENFNERSKLVKELVASEKYNPSEMKDILQKKYNVDMGNTIQKEINEARKRGKIIPSAKVGETSTNTQKLLYDINLLNENKKIKSILSNPELDFEKDYSKIVNEVKDTLKINDSKANYRLAYLLQAYSDGKIPSNKNIINNSNKVTTSITENRPFGSLGSVLRRKLQVEPGVASQINEDPKYFSKSRKEISRKLPGGYATDEIKGLASSFENLTGRYSVFVQGIKGDINLNKGRTIDKLMNTTEKQLQNLDTRDVDYLDKRETIKDKYNERVKEFTNKYNKDLKKGELPVRGLELSFDTPKNSLARYNELKKINPGLIEGVEDIYNKYNYSFKVHADVKTIPEALGFVKSPEGQKLMQKAADVNAARIYADPTGIGNFLETSVGQSLSKSAPNLLKTTARLSAVTGTPINALIGVALYADEFKEMGLGDLETIAAGAYKGSTQDLLNFGDLITRKLGVATYEKFVKDKPFLENWLSKPELFEFADKQIDKYASEKSIKDRIENRAEHEVRKSFIPNISDAEVPFTETSEEFKNLKEIKKNEILNSDTNLKKQYEQETTVTPQLKKDPFQNLMLGPLVFPKYTQEELNLAKGGRVKFANGSDDPESDLYIPSLMPNRYNERGEDGILSLAVGGRAGFKDGPSDPTKRKFIKGAGVVGALGVAAKYAPDLFTAAKKAAPKIAKVISNAPEWFSTFLSKVVNEKTFLFEGVQYKGGPKSKIHNYVDPVSGKKVGAIDEGDSIDFQFETDAGMPGRITYIKPSTKIDPKTGEKIELPGLYEESELVYRGQGDEYTKDVVEEIISGREGIARIGLPGKTSKTDKAKYNFEEAQGQAEAELDRLKDSGILDD
jgi:hypothetical protein